SAPVFFRCPESTAPPRRAGTSSPIAGGQHVSYASGRDERREQEREQEQETQSLKAECRVSRAQRKGDAGGASNTVRRSAGTGGGGGQGG
ncbi:unnamed protein product, partial [Prorocentrum cordatum]